MHAPAAGSMLVTLQGSGVAVPCCVKSLGGWLLVCCRRSHHATLLQVSCGASWHKVPHVGHLGALVSVVQWVSAACAGILLPLH